MAQTIQVLKIGSSSLMKAGTIRELARAVARLRINKGAQVVLVSSGAVGFGCRLLGIPKPKSVHTKQAVAAVGQPAIMREYERQFASFAQPVAQVLLTKDCIESSARSRRILNTFNELFKLGVLPIVNENDTVSTNEIKFGDNDMLAARTSALLGARRLFLITDVAGVYTHDPRDSNARFIPNIKCGELDAVMAKTHSVGNSYAEASFGTGGFRTKLLAAKIATSRGTDTTICSYKELARIGADTDHDLGTLISAC